MLHVLETSNFILLYVCNHARKIVGYENVSFNVSWDNKLAKNVIFMFILLVRL